jgi:hypothetical protein
LFKSEINSPAILRSVGTEGCFEISTFVYKKYVTPIADSDRVTSLEMCCKTTFPLWKQRIFLSWKFTFKIFRYIYYRKFCALIYRPPTVNEYVISAIELTMCSSASQHFSYRKLVILKYMTFVWCKPYIIMKSLCSSVFITRWILLSTAWNEATE